MRTFILAGAAALAFAIPGAAIAQNVAMDATGNVYVLTDSQQSMYDGWPAEQQGMYDGWPYNLQEYYWSLTPIQQTGWWRLNNDQRMSVYQMTPDQRIAAWNQIAAQMNGQSTSNMAATTAKTSGMSNSSMSPRFVSKPVVQSIPAADMVTPSANPPICTKDQQNNCINAWAAGERGKGVVKPLNYWPGEPASEINGN